MFPLELLDNSYRISYFLFVVQQSLVAGEKLPNRPGTWSEGDRIRFQWISMWPEIPPSTGLAAFEKFRKMSDTITVILVSVGGNQREKMAPRPSTRAWCAWSGGLRGQVELFPRSAVCLAEWGNHLDPVWKLLTWKNDSVIPDLPTPVMNLHAIAWCHIWDSTSCLQDGPIGVLVAQCVGNWDEKRRVLGLSSSAGKRWQVFW